MARWPNPPTPMTTTGAARVSEGQDLLDGVVVGRPASALRSEGCRVGARRQLDDGTGARPHEVGIAAIHSVDAGELPSRAVHVVAGSAGDAEAARDGPDGARPDRPSSDAIRPRPLPRFQPAFSWPRGTAAWVEGSLQATLHDVECPSGRTPAPAIPDDHVVRIDDLRLRTSTSLTGSV